MIGVLVAVPIVCAGVLRRTRENEGPRNYRRCASQVRDGQEANRVESRPSVIPLSGLKNSFPDCVTINAVAISSRIPTGEIPGSGLPAELSPIPA